VVEISGDECVSFTWLDREAMTRCSCSGRHL